MQIRSVATASLPESTFLGQKVGVMKKPFVMCHDISLDIIFPQMRKRTEKMTLYY